MFGGSSHRKSKFWHQAAVMNVIARGHPRHVLQRHSTGDNTRMVPGQLLGLHGALRNVVARSAAHGVSWPGVHADALVSWFESGVRPPCVEDSAP